MEALLTNTQSYASESSLLAKCGMLATALGAVLYIYGLSLVIYRLYFDPLAGFPGPRIAAATGWYEFYHDVVRRGQCIYKIEEMHKKYGIVLPRTGSLSSANPKSLFSTTDDSILTLSMMSRPHPPNKPL